MGPIQTQQKLKLKRPKSVLYNKTRRNTKQTSWNMTRLTKVGIAPDSRCLNTKCGQIKSNQFGTGPGRTQDCANYKMRKYLLNVRKIGGAHLQFVNNHCAKFE